jgi:hypothetical protein
MKRITLISIIAAVFMLINQSARSQNEYVFPSKLFYVEMGGPGLIFSANFDSRFKSGERLGLGYKIGIGFCIGDFDEEYVSDGYGYGGYYESYTHSYYSIPIGLNYVFGKEHSSNTFEIGAGAAFLTREANIAYDDPERGHFIGYLSFMYRRVPVDGGFTFRVGFSPIIGTSGDLIPLPAIGIGYAF